MVKNINIMLPVFFIFYFISCTYAAGSSEEITTCEYIFISRDTLQIKIYEEL